MKRRKPIPVDHEPIPPAVLDVMRRRAAEAVRIIGKCVHPVTLNEIAMCGYYAGLEDMATALRSHPECVLEARPKDDCYLM